MGQYRFAMHFEWQLGVLISYDIFGIDIQLPFISIYIGTTQEAKGYNIFNILKS